MIFAFLLASGSGRLAQAATSVSGVISNSFWSTAGSPYTLRDYSYTAPGVTLSIAPGVVVLGRSLSGLIQATSVTFSNEAVSGTLNLNGCNLYGTDVSATGPSVISACTVLGAQTGIGISATNSSVDDCTVEGCSAWGVALYVAAPVTNCRLRSNRVGLYLDGMNPPLTGTTFTANTNCDVFFDEGSYSGDLTLRCAKVVYITTTAWHNGVLRLEGPMQVVGVPHLFDPGVRYLEIRTNAELHAEGVDFAGDLVTADNAVITLSNCTVAAYSEGLVMNGGQATVENTRFGQPRGLQQYSYGLLVSGPARATLRGCSFTNFAIGVWVAAEAGTNLPVRVSDCVIDSCGSGFYLFRTNLVVEGCAIQNCSIYGGVVYAPLTISRCQVRNNNVGLSLGGATPVLIGTTLTANTNWDVHLSEGSYSGDLTLNCAKVLYTTTTAWQNGVLRLEGPMQVVGGVHIFDPGVRYLEIRTNAELHAEGVDFAGDLVMADNAVVTLSNCTAAAYSSGLVMNGGQATLENTRFGEARGVHEYGYGLLIYGAARATLRGCSFTNFATGVYLAAEAATNVEVRISDCTISACGTGLNTRRTNAVLENCAVENCSSYGALVYAPLTFTNCLIQANALGLYLSAATPRLLETTLVGNTNVDVQIHPAAYSGDLRLRCAKVGLEYGTVDWTRGNLVFEGPTKASYSGGTAGFGLLYIGTNASLVATDTTFRGTIAVRDNGVVGVTNCVFFLEANSDWVSGLILWGGEASVEGSQFGELVGNRAYGYGLLVYGGGRALAHGCTFTNFATGVYLEAETGTNVEVRISDCTISACGTGLNTRRTNAVLENCTVENCSSYGALVYAPLTFTNCLIQANALGLYLADATPRLLGTTLVGNTNVDVQIHPAAYSGNLRLRCAKVGLEYGTVDWTRGNLVFEGPTEASSGGGTAGFGLLYIGTNASLVATDTTFRGTIAVRDNGVVGVTNCVFLEVNSEWASGLILWGGQASVEGSQFGQLVGNRAYGYGVLEYAGGRAVARGCTFTNFPIAIWVATSNLTARYCNFADCAQGVLNASTAWADARYCWWGDPNGPGPIGPGHGAKVSNYVRYDPWMTDNTPVIVVNPTLLDFGEAQTQLPFEVWNAGGGTLTYQLTNMPAWATNVAPISGSSTNASDRHTHSITIDRSALPPGTNTATITITSAQATNSPQTVQLRAVRIPPPSIALSPTNLDFGDTLSQLAFDVWNAGGGILTYQLTNMPPWATNIIPASGSSTNASDRHTHTVTLDRTKLPLGTNAATITITSTNADNGSQAVQLTAQRNSHLQITRFEPASGAVNVAVDSPIFVTVTDDSPLNLYGDAITLQVHTPGWDYLLTGDNCDTPVKSPDGRVWALTFDWFRILRSNRGLTAANTGFGWGQTVTATLTVHDTNGFAASALNVFTTETIQQQASVPEPYPTYIFSNLCLNECGPVAVTYLLSFWDDHASSGQGPFEELVQGGDGTGANLGDVYALKTEVRQAMGVACGNPSSDGQVQTGIKAIFQQRGYGARHTEVSAWPFYTWFHHLEDEVNHGRPVIYHFWSARHADGNNHFATAFGYLRGSQTAWLLVSDSVGTSSPYYVRWNSAVLDSVIMLWPAMLEPVSLGVPALTGGTVAVGSNGAYTQHSLTVPPGALDADTTITITPPPPEVKCINGAAADFGPPGTTFRIPATVTVQFTPQDIPPGSAAADMRLYVWNGSLWDPVPGSTVDTNILTVSAPVSHLSVYCAATASDQDADGLIDLNEYVLGTNPFNPDTDGDGMSDGQEFLAGTDPNSAASVFKITSVHQNSNGSLLLQWSSVSNKLYEVKRSLSTSRASTVTLISNVAATPPVNSFIDAAPTNAAAFYWIEVH